jgi:hypothetical protein
MQKTLLMLGFLLFGAGKAMRLVELAARYFVVSERLALVAPGARGFRVFGIVLHQKILRRQERKKRNSPITLAMRKETETDHISNSPAPRPKPNNMPENAA